MRNLWMYVSIEIYLAGASEAGYWEAKGLPTGGKCIKKGFGKSPKQAYKDSLNNINYKGNCETSTILSDYVFFLNGKEKYRAKHSDRLIKSNGSIN